jgi:hypothetical protein
LHLNRGLPGSTVYDLKYRATLQRQPAGFSGNQAPKIGRLNQADNRG